MPHHHHHCHHGPVNYNRAFAIGVALNVVYVAVEAACGFAVNSLSLLADAGHNLSDVLGLLLAWGAHFLSGVKPTKRRTYGWGSTSILAAMFNGLLLLVAMGAIVWEAVQRLLVPSPVAGTMLMVVAGIGVLVNTATALLFLRGRHSDLNIKGAFLHMAADAGVSLAVVIGGAGIMLYGWHWLDPGLSLLISFVIVVGTWDLMRDSINLALHAVPADIDPVAVRKYLAELPGVTEVHDLHIWAISTRQAALTAHLVNPACNDNDSFLRDVCQELHDRFGIDHATLQLERGTTGIPCRLAAPDSV